MLRKHVYAYALVAVAALTVVLSAVSSALAVAHHPTGVFAPFADCPLGNPAVTACVRGNITSGELVLGKKMVPITKTITLQGGLIPVGNIGEALFVAAEGGETLSRTVLSVPGGLSGIAGSARTNEATVTPELAGPASAIQIEVENLLTGTGIALRLPIKAKLDSPVLGNSCYEGSLSAPLVLNMTTGTTSPPLPNTPIAGNAGKVGSEGGVVSDKGTSLVDNAFAAPAVSGCGGVYPSLISSAMGLPSPAGRNTAILTGTLELAAPSMVRESE